MKKVFTFFFIAFVLIASIISIWFSEGKFIANGSEENFNVFHSQRSAEYASSFWRSVGTGYKTSFLISTYSVFAVLGELEKSGVPAFIRQASLLAILMMVGVISTYFLIKRGLNLGEKAAYIGGVFYFLNIYAMTQIWKRFIYAHMFAWACLPLFSFLWIRWIDTQKFLWLFLFVVSSLFFTFTFSNPVFLLTIWTPAIIFSLVKLWNERSRKKQFIYTLLYSFIGLFLWLIVNIWWLYPTLTLGSTWAAQTGQTWQSDLGSLHAVSKYFPIGEIAFLRQSWYLGHENDWFDFYHNPLIYLISFMVLAIMIYGVVKSKKLPYWKYLIVLAGVGLFISKGTSFPFGYSFFEILFSKFSLTVALRNSYEKFGIVWLLPYTIFFAIGLSTFINKFSKIKRYLVLTTILFLSCGVLVYPMWSGDIFPASRHRFNVPSDYIETNNYLKKQEVIDNRIFHIPSLIELERVTYSWGFIGEDPSDNLFDAEVLSKPATPGFDPVYRIIHKNLFEKETSRLLGFLGVENVIFHKDNIYPKIDIKDVQDKIERWDNIKNKKDFGQLVVYTLDSKIVKPRVYVAANAKLVASLEDGIKGILNKSMDTNNTIFVTENYSNVLSMQNAFIPQIYTQKLSLTNYKVEIKKANGPFILVLNNAFDKSWELKIDKEIIEPHFIANGFVNGWIINKDGNYSADIKLIVWPWDKN